MEFKQSKIIISFSLILLQVFFSYASPVSEEEIEKAVYFEKPSHWGDKVYSFVYSDYSNDQSRDTGRSLARWPGNEMIYEDGMNRYVYYYANKYFNHNSHIIFSDGKYQKPYIMDEGFPLTEDGLYNENGLKGICKIFNESLWKYTCKKNYVQIFYVKQPSWKNVYVQYKIGQNDWKKQQLFISERFQKKYQTTIDLGNEEEIILSFTDGNGHWDNNDGMNYKMKALEDKVFGQ